MDIEHIVYTPTGTLGTLYDIAIFRTPTQLQIGDTLAAYGGDSTNACVLGNRTLDEAKRCDILGISPITTSTTAIDCAFLVRGACTTRLTRALFVAPLPNNPAERRQYWPRPGTRLGYMTHNDEGIDPRYWGRLGPVPAHVNRGRSWNGYPDDVWIPSPIDERWGKFASIHHNHRHYVKNMAPPPETCHAPNAYTLKDRIFAFVCEWILSPGFDITDQAQLQEVLRKCTNPAEPLPDQALRLDLTWYSRRPITHPPVPAVYRSQFLVLRTIPINDQIDVLSDY